MVFGARTGTGVIMKVARFAAGGNDGERLGAVVETDGTEQLLDVAAMAFAESAATGAPRTMMELIGSGAKGLDLVAGLIERWRLRQEPAWCHKMENVTWLTPVPERSCIAAGRNFGAHRLESMRGNPQAGSKFQTDFPTGFIKLGRSLVPQGATVKRPADVRQMDYEVEVALIIGSNIERASRAEAAAAIFGYTVFNDLSAREWQLNEMKNQLVMMGKNFPGFGPMGPYILTADEVPRPQELRLWLKVNGELRQQSDCADLIFQFDELVEFWSRVGLTPGDIISSGTPEGVALHRKPDPEPFFLKPGDVVEAAVEQIGVLTTHIA